MDSVYYDRMLYLTENITDIGLDDCYTIMKPKIDNEFYTNNITTKK